MIKLLKLEDEAKIMAMAALTEENYLRKGMTFVVLVPEMPDLVRELEKLKHIKVTVLVALKGVLKFDIECHLDLFSDTSTIFVEHLDQKEGDEFRHVDVFAYYNGQAEKIDHPAMKIAFDHTFRRAEDFEFIKRLQIQAPCVLDNREGEQSGVNWQAGITDTEILGYCET